MSFVEGRERERHTVERGGGFASIEQFFSLKFDVRRKDDERRDLGWRPRLQQLLTALPALHAPRSREGSGEICGASRNREIEFANFWIGAEVVGRGEGPVVSRDLALSYQAVAKESSRRIPDTERRSIF